MTRTVTEKLAVIGQGYAGLPLAIRAVEAGFSVVGIDIDARKVDSLAAGVSTVEDLSSERLAAALSTGRYLPATDVADAAGFDVAVISVPTPLIEGVPDLGFIEAAAGSIAPYLRRGACVILESTTYPGTTEEVVGPILARMSGLRAGLDFHLGYSPERIDPTNEHWSFENTPKIVSGVDDESTDVVQRFYDRLVEATVRVSSTRVAEMTKLLENTFRHVNIALVNEVAMFANDLNIDVWEAIDAATTKPFGFMRFEPGPGVGGHCLPIDPTYLSWRVQETLGASFRFVELANEINGHMPDYVVERIIRHFYERELRVKGRQVLLLGLSYKKNTGDIRESPSLRIAELLVANGAVVSVADPYVSSDFTLPGVLRVEATEETCASVDLVVLLVDHDRFDLAAIVEASSHIFDTRNVLRGENVESL